MAKKKLGRSGRISLYWSGELHAEVAALAETLGLDINALVRLMVGRSMAHYRMEARIIAAEAEQADGAFAKWRQDNPRRPAREFLDDYARQQRGQWLKDQVQFWQDVRFTVDEAYAATTVGESPRVPVDATPIKPRKER